jgi:hypothetical protein
MYSRTAPATDGPFGFVLLAAMVGIMMYFHFRRSRKIPLTGHDVALKLGLKFRPDSTSNIQPRFAFINRLQYGKKHHALNVLNGSYRNHKIVIFDFCYDADVLSPKDSTGDQYCFYTVELPHSFPEVTIYKEGLFSKLVQLAGHNDIDFESHEFSRKFRVRAADAKFAYDFCNARMIEYLLDNTDLSIEIDHNILCISFNKPLDFEAVEYNLKRLLEIRSLMPDYVFDS